MMERKRFTKAVKKVTAVALAAAMFFGMMPIKSVFAADGVSKSLTIKTSPATTVAYGKVPATVDDLLKGGVCTVATTTTTPATSTTSETETTVKKDFAMTAANGFYIKSGYDPKKLGEQTVTIGYKYVDTSVTPSDREATTTFKVTVVNYDLLVACYGVGFSALDPASTAADAGMNGGTITVLKGDKLDLSKCFVRYTKADGTMTDIAVTEDKLLGSYDLTKAGTYNLRLSCKYTNDSLAEATKDLQIKLVVTDFVYKAGITYRAHVQNVGWQEWKDEGVMAGTTGKSLRMEALKINAVVMKPDATTGAMVTTNEIESPVLYESHIQNAGWENSWTKSNTNFYSGTVGSSLRMEAVKIKLNDTLAKGYDIYYRVHIQNKGWTGWLKNGEEAGTTGKSLRLEAIEIRLDEKA